MVRAWAVTKLLILVLAFGCSSKPERAPPVVEDAPRVDAAPIVDARPPFAITRRDTSLQIVVHDAKCPEIEWRPEPKMLPSVAVGDALQSIATASRWSRICAARDRRDDLRIAASEIKTRTGAREAIRHGSEDASYTQEWHPRVDREGGEQRGHDAELA